MKGENLTRKVKIEENSRLMQAEGLVEVALATLLSWPELSFL